MIDAIEGYPLSAQQERIWRLRDDSASFAPFCAQAVFQLPFDAPRVESALKAVVEGLEILRTSFHRLPGMTTALQVAGAASRLSVERLRWDTVAREKARELLASQASLPLDPVNGPFVIAAVIELDDGRSAVACTMSTLHADLRSIRLLAGQVAAACAGRMAPEAETGVPYIDVSEWQRGQWESAVAAGDDAFWRSLDSETLTQLDWPVPDVGRAGAPFERRVLESQLETLVLEHLSAAARRCESELRDALLASWIAALARWTGRDDIAVGMTVDGRNEPRLPESVGPLSQVLPVRCAIDRTLAFCDLVGLVRSARRAACDHAAAFSWDLLPRAVSRQPFFSAGFSFEDDGVSDCDGDCVFDPLSDGNDRFQVNLAIERRARGAGIRFEYDAARITDSEAERLLRQWTVLLADAAAAPATRIGRLSLLADVERRALVERFEGLRDTAGTQAFVHTMFEEHARRSPDRVAIVCEEQTVQYEELERRCNALAALLARSGIGADTRVATYIANPILAIEAMFATLKAGGSYAVLDTRQPRVRLRQMLDDLSPSLVLTECAAAAELPAGPWPVMTVDAAATESAAPGDRRSPAAVHPDNLAYVTYTSGSTGRPKGVLVEHRQLANYVLASRRALQLDGCHSMACVSTLAADLGNTVVFGALCGGATLHMIPHARAVDPEWMARYFERHDIDVVKITPSHLSVLATASTLPRPRKRLILGGEPPDLGVLRRVSARLDGCWIYNHYGPTETTVGVLIRRIEPDDLTRTRVPLAVALDNTQVYLLDDDLQVVPPGLVGDVYIGGATVARGYHADPALTAERFIPDPFGGLSGERIYRTGDRARQLGDMLEILGREDRQIKVRGIRVEPGEIESVMRGVPGVADAVVVPLDGEPRLVAYAIEKTAGTIDVGELRRQFRERLPDYLRPEHVEVLERLPLTANGKLDVNALPRPPKSSGADGAQEHPPCTVLEAAIVGIWKRLLHVDAVPLDENFFDCGGHSLLMIEMNGYLRDELGVELSIVDLFDHSTVRALAEYIRSREPASDHLRESAVRAELRHVLHSQSPPK